MEQLDVAILDTFADKVVTGVDVLGSSMMRGVLRQCLCTFVVDVKHNCTFRSDVKLC